MKPFIIVQSSSFDGTLKQNLINVDEIICVNPSENDDKHVEIMLNNNIVFSCVDGNIESILDLIHKAQNRIIATQQNVYLKSATLL